MTIYLEVHLPGRPPRVETYQPAVAETAERHYRACGIHVRRFAR